MLNQNKIKQFFKYCLFGGIVAIFEIIIFSVLLNFGLNYFFATPLSFIFAAIFNFILQRKFTFKNKYLKKHEQFTVFIIISIGGLIINWFITVSCINLFLINPIIAKITAILCALGYNYTLNKKITFGKMK
ncbi:MAG: GtrA family protein [Candidatus ainarchaeum sp.]|nr:GtrA family protein [Candidatus ainarchaeum sp.]